MTGSAEIRKTGRKPANTNVCRSPRVYPKFRLGGGVDKSKKPEAKVHEKENPNYSEGQFIVLLCASKVFESFCLTDAPGSHKNTENAFRLFLLHLID